MKTDKNLQKAPKEFLAEPLTLPCGQTINNRFVKAATSENLGSTDNRVTPGLVRLYDRLAQGGTGLIITGNVMVDRTALGEPKNVVLDDDRDMALLKEWSKTARKHGAQIWMQLNHPGKQSPKNLSKEPVGPSAIGFAPPMDRFFNVPKAMTQAQIQALVDAFANSARLAEEAGFTGVEIHGAHGYLLSQFLSPRHNQRQDQYGGSLENRCRIVMEVCHAIRKTVDSSFAVGLKLNSADFRHNGFSEEESKQAAVMFCETGIDLLEISGGSYESPAMAGKKMDARVEKGEAYFLAFAEKIRNDLSVPLAVTGGFRTARGMSMALLENATDMIGLARPLCVDPDLPKKILQGEEYTSKITPIKTGVSLIDSAAFLEIAWYELQLEKMAKGKEPDLHLGAWAALAKTMAKSGLDVFARRRARL